MKQSNLEFEFLYYRQKVKPEIRSDLDSHPLGYDTLRLNQSALVPLLSIRWLTCTASTPFFLSFSLCTEAQSGHSLITLNLPNILNLSKAEIRLRMGSKSEVCHHKSNTHTHTHI